MRASRSLSTRLATIGATVALTASGLAGVAAVAAPAGPAGADTPIGTTTCTLSAPAGVTPITASVSAAITPNPVPAGNNFIVTGLALHTTLVANATTSVAAGQTLSVNYTTNLLATGATPASQNATFAGSVTLPNPFPIGATAAVLAERHHRRVHVRCLRGLHDHGVDQPGRKPVRHPRHLVVLGDVHRTAPGADRQCADHPGRRVRHQRDPELGSGGRRQHGQDRRATTSAERPRSTSAARRPPASRCSAPT